MLYPLKFKPVYKDYIWGGRNFEKYGRILPDGIVAESWEVSCHPNGISIVSNGAFEGISLPELVKKLGRKLIGNALPEKDLDRFPLLVKFIDANDDLSVQVHPDDNYAFVHDNGEYGKNEMWYIISAEPGARLVFDLVPGTSKNDFIEAVKNGSLEKHLRYIDVYPGDVLNIPAGLVHAVGKGIILAEIQQNSDATYRIYDFNRVGKDGKKRPLHIDKALDVINFNSETPKEKTKGIRLKLDSDSSKTYLVANKYFSVELLDVNGKYLDLADGSKFRIFSFIDGEGEIIYKNGSINFKTLESVLIPADMGEYEIAGRFKALKAYVPELEKDVIAPLVNAGYTKEEILNALY